MKRSLNNQILKSIILILTISSIIFYFLTYNKIENTINENQFFLYNKSIQTKIYLLEEKYKRLQDTGLPQAYEKSFKEGILTLFKKMFYGKELEIYPFIINAKNKTYILHPSYNKKNQQKYKNSTIFKKSINIKDGEFNLKDTEEPTWVIIQHFKQWDWIIGYSVPYNIKYKSLYAFQSNFILLSIILLLIVSIIVYIATKILLNPINKLIIESKKIKDGNLESNISINASYELSELSNNFISMRDAVKSNINELNQTKEILRNIIDNAPVRIFWKDKEGNFLGANKLFLEDFGNIDINDLIGKSDMDFNIKEAKKYRKDDLEIINKNKSKLNFIETQTFDKDKELTLTTSKVPLHNSKGEVMGILGVYNDITEQVKMQSKLKEKELFIIQQSKLASMGEMIGNIAHQWRQPLSLISTVATGMGVQKEMGLLNDKIILESIDEINQAVQFLSKTIDDFRNFCNPNKPKNKFFISHTFDVVIKLVQTQLIEKDIEVINNINDFKMVGYENELIQVFINIFNNARDELIKKENQKRLILITAEENNKEFVIKIKDNAGGVPSDIIDRIFEPYFTTKHQSQGTGIGLYMSEEIIRKHMNGILTIKNESYTFDKVKQKGAEFTISIKKS